MALLQLTGLPHVLLCVTEGVTHNQQHPFSTLFGQHHFCILILRTQTISLLGSFSLLWPLSPLEALQAFFFSPHNSMRKSKSHPANKPLALSAVQQMFISPQWVEIAILQSPHGHPAGPGTEADRKGIEAPRVQSEHKFFWLLWEQRAALIL